MEKRKETIEELTKRYQMLDKKKTTAEANLKNAEEMLSELEKEAIEKYGTSDLDELKQKLLKMENENEEKRKDYQEALEKIENDLEIIEEEYNGVK